MKKKAILFCIFLILIISCILIYSRYVGTTGLNIKEQKISYKELDNDFYGLKIVHITDIHYGTTFKLKELENLVNKINLTKPDIVVFTGDLVDQKTDLTEEDKSKIAETLSKIDANIGKYAITGDHDILREGYNILIENCGFTNLDNKYDLIYTKSSNYILIAGMSTNTSGDLTPTEKLASTYEYINSVEKKPNYTILLMHEPDFIDQIGDYEFNLVLAGHSHGGQIKLPFISAIYTPDGAKKYHEDYYKIKTTDLYISSGLGTSNFSFRLFNRPSFNLYRLVN